jgi:hypothetical protein
MNPPSLPEPTAAGGDDGRDHLHEWAPSPYDDYLRTLGGDAGTPTWLRTTSVKEAGETLDGRLDRPSKEAGLNNSQSGTSSCATADLWELEGLKGVGS